MFDAFHDVEEKMKKGNPYAKKVVLKLPSSGLCMLSLWTVRSWNRGRMQSGSRIVLRCQTKSST